MKNLLLLTLTFGFISSEAIAFSGCPETIGENQLKKIATLKDGDSFEWVDSKNNEVTYKNEPSIHYLLPKDIEEGVKLHGTLNKEDHKASTRCVYNVWFGNKMTALYVYLAHPDKK